MSDPISLEYLAGCTDTGSYMGVYNRADRGTTALAFAIQRADRDIPDLFSARFGGKVHFVVNKSDGYQRYDWLVRGKKAQAALRELIPHLRLKRLRAEQLCAIVVPNRGGNRRGSPRLKPEKSIGFEMQRQLGVTA